MSDDAAAAEKISAGGALRFRLPIYEGPLDLLLHLIKKAELDPQDVTASAITEQYLAYLELLNEFNLDVAGEYLVMAATLLLIKSFSLLPELGASDQEEIEELKRDLIERLLEYQRYREAADSLAKRLVVGRDVFTTPGEPAPDDDGEQPRFSVSLFDLVEVMSALLKRLRDRAPRTLDLRAIPVEECIPRIMSAFGGEVRRVEFAALFEGVDDRQVLIATFVALLELIRRQTVRAYQEARFGPIWLELAGGAGGEAQAG